LRALAAKQGAQPAKESAKRLPQEFAYWLIGAGRAARQAPFAFLPFGLCDHRAEREVFLVADGGKEVFVLILDGALADADGEHGRARWHSFASIRQVKI
jgi:hypothetical protein